MHFLTFKTKGTHCCWYINIRCTNNGLHIRLAREKAAGSILAGDINSLWDYVWRKTQTRGATCCGNPFVGREQLKVAFTK